MFLLLLALSNPALAEPEPELNIGLVVGYGPAKNLTGGDDGYNALAGMRMDMSYSALYIPMHADIVISNEPGLIFPEMSTGFGLGVPGPFGVHGAGTVGFGLGIAAVMVNYGVLAGVRVGPVLVDYRWRRGVRTSEPSKFSYQSVELSLVFPMDDL